MRMLSSLCVLAFAMVSVQAEAVIFKPTGAAASSIASSNYDPIYTIDGSGLTGNGTDITEAHADYVIQNHWTSANFAPTDQWIDWTFSTPVTIGAAYIWNHRSNVIASNPGYEPTLFDLTFFDLDNNVLLFLDDRPLLPDTAFAQRIDFELVSNVSRVRFDVEAVQSSTGWTGLAEVAFDSQSYLSSGAVPEPESWAMLIAGFGLVGAAMRRRESRRAAA